MRTRSILVAAFALWAFAVAAVAQPARPALTPQEEARVRALVRETLIANPEILEEALIALQEKRQAEQAARLGQLRKQIENDGRDYALGPKDAPITIVEFFDYRCPYCKSAADWLFAAVRNRRDIRVVFKEYPVLGEQSVEASKAAIATIRQGGDIYLRFHQALMAHRGAMDAAVIDRLAASAGVDVRRMRRDMASPEVDKLIADNRAIGAAAGVNGTPAFLINGAFVGGFDQEALDEALRAAVSSR